MDPLLSVTDLEDITGLGLEPARAGLLLAQASAAVRAYCGWHIAPLLTGAVVVVDGNWSRTVGLPTLHLVGVASVTENGEPVDLAEISWSTYGALQRSCRWTPRRRGISAVIDHGYETVPEEVGAVVCSMVTRAGSNPLGVVREQTGPFSVTYPQSAPNQAGGMSLWASEKDILGPYRIPGI